jgi:hypothetical protein
MEADMVGCSEKKLLLPHELARALSVSIAWVYTHAAPSSKKQIPTIRVGGLLRFDLEKVLEALERQGENDV